MYGRTKKFGLEFFRQIQRGDQINAREMPVSKRPKFKAEIGNRRSLKMSLFKLLLNRLL